MKKNFLILLIPGFMCLTGCVTFDEVYCNSNAVYYRPAVMPLCAPPRFMAGPRGSSYSIGFTYARPVAPPPVINRPQNVQVNYNTYVAESPSFDHSNRETSLIHDQPDSTLPTHYNDSPSDTRISTLQQDVDVLKRKSQDQDRINSWVKYKFKRHDHALAVIMNAIQD